MSDADSSFSVSPSIDTLSLESGGSLLREARESSGLSVAALAALLKVSTAKLDALESNRWDLLPDIVFARALASSVCRALQIEVAPVLARFPSQATPSMKTDESGINAPFRARSDGVRLTGLSLFRKPSSVAVFTLIIAAVALFFLPLDLLKTRFGGSIVENSEKGVQLAEMTQADLTPNVSNLASSTAELGVQTDVVNQTLSEIQPLTAVPKQIEASPLPLQVDGSGARTGTVVLKATGASWVEVVDGRGVVQVRKIMAEGEMLGASGEEPLSVVIGRADVVSAEVRGKAFNLTNLTKNNVARFEVK